MDTGGADARDFAMMISVCADILTGLLVMRFVHGGWHEYFVMAVLSGVL